MHQHHHHTGHDHGDRAANAWRLGSVLVLSAFYMLAEVVGGLLTGSLALLADAGHMLSDVASLGLALIAIWIAQRPASSQRTYGHARAEILAALANGVTLVAVAVLVVVEAIERFSSPVEIHGLPMLAIAAGGLVVNGVGIWVLSSSGSQNLNMRGAFLHVVSDAFGSVGVIVAGGLIWLFGWMWADAVASMVICVLVLWSAWFLLREALDVLMETVPKHLELGEIRAALLALPAVGEIHDLHVWTIGSSEVSLSSHVVANTGAAYPELLTSIHDELAQRFGIQHATIQIEPERGTDGSDGDGCATACDEPAALAGGQ
jgi:cobalt-zinc-cadmium efflux system protein